MSLRTILNSAIAGLILLSAHDLRAQESPAKRMASIAGVAVEEYAKGVDSKGVIFARGEYDEATSFLADARGLADRVADGRGPALAVLLDAMRAAAAALVAPDSLAALNIKLVVVLGPDANLDYPRAEVDLAQGRALYVARCASCHGDAGLGDGPGAKGLLPKPVALGDAALMADVTPALMYRIVSVGIQGTAMKSFADLTPAQRWNVVTYVNTLRDSESERTRGAALLAARCTRCEDGTVPAGHTLPWLAERNDSGLLSALRAGDALLGMESQPPLNAIDARAILAALRAAPRLAISGERTPAAVASDVLRMLDESLLRARGGAGQDAADLAFDAYIAFEPLESNVRSRDPGLISGLESQFATFKGAVRSADVVSASAARERIAAGMPRVVLLADSPASGWSAFFESLLIIVREGFEAILILGAVAAFLIKTGNRARLREIWIGALGGLGASAVLAVVLRTALANAPASREVIEGATMLIAVVVLFSVSYWLLSKVESARWQAFIREKVGDAVSSGSTRALALVAFLAVFREGAETALFYQALLARGPQVVSPVLGGLVVGTLLLGLIWFGFHQFGVRLPLRAFFATTSALLYYLAFVFMGKGIRELQEGNILSLTPIRGAPYLDMLGLYPSVETIVGQSVLLALALFALWRALAVRQPVELRAESPRPASDSVSR